MKIGASTSCLYPMVTELALYNLLEMGVMNLEIFFNTSSELDKKFVKSMKREVKRHKGKILSLHPYSSSFEPYMFFSDYERRFSDMLEDYKKYFEAANELGAELIVIHGDKLPARLPEEKYFERFARIMECGKEYGVVVAQENVNLHRSQDPEFLCRMREWIGEETKFVFDVKQAVRAGFDPYDFAERLGSGIAHIHVNDNDSKAHCMLPGKGEMDYLRLKSIVQKNGCDPNWVAEVYRTNYGEAYEIKESVEWLDNLLNGENE